jgi:hypothetical protein
MSGSVRVERVIDLPHLTALDAVFTGRLVDADGTTIGVGSRRQQVPAARSAGAHGTHLSVGPLQVDILGLSVSLPAFALPAADSRAADADVTTRRDEP